MGNKAFPLNAEIVVSAFMVAFAAAQVYAANQLSLSADYTLGPGALPMIYSVGLLICSAAVLFESVRQGGSDGVGEKNSMRGVLCILLLVLFVASIYVVGFLFSTIVFCFLFCQFFSGLGLVKNIAFSVIWGAALYAAFHYLLEVPLEPGLLFS
ncbi:tripartite tricarboxylate transporter TctB family protein [Ancylobacter mangrovi]|uniref:tripartite tricarboxylate transporter TctB family protein n=1 Tax=Ancylobacter mangrovi TaxID=2972472 RepID=UPI002162DE63|nr:tripartite tricarboxylate transporter TctB family protein [Ancylobacter mangrovi]MCS0505012.1 tripartite tricarboxylate transporter TctB family protein [Ancylobacter mangrovi]